MVHTLAAHALAEHAHGGRPVTRAAGVDGMQALSAHTGQAFLTVVVRDATSSEGRGRRTHTVRAGKAGHAIGGNGARAAAR
jgi:hypothetical protein